MAEWNEAEAQKTLTEVSKRTQTDPEFRKLALSNPSAAISKVNSTPLPSGFKVRFVDNNGANLTVVLPDAESKEGELSDVQLEHVAGGGGRCGGSCAASCVISSVL
jgi:hypothetical protein